MGKWNNLSLISAVSLNNNVSFVNDNVQSEAILNLHLRNKLKMSWKQEVVRNVSMLY